MFAAGLNLVVFAAESDRGVPTAADALTRDSTFALYVDAARVSATGSWRALKDLLPAIEEEMKGKLSQHFGPAGSLEKMKDLPDFPWDSLAELAITTKGQLDLGSGQKSSKDASLAAVARFSKAVDVGKLIDALLARVETEKPGSRAKAEKTRRKLGEATLVDVPSELFEGEAPPFTVSLAGVSAGEATWLGVGRKETVEKLVQRRGGGGDLAAAKRYVPAGAQVWLYAPVPPEASQALAGGGGSLAQGNPMLGPMAQGLKDVRELALALSFGDRNLDLVLALGCADGKASSELGAGLQGLLGFIQSAAAQNPQQNVSFLRNLKVAVEGGTVRVLTSLNPTDLLGARDGGGNRQGKTTARAESSSRPAAPELTPNQAPPVTVQFLGLIPGEGESVRWGRVQFKNTATKAVRGAQLRFQYLDKSGRMIGEWVRRHTDLEAETLVGAGATRVSQTPVFQMPPETSQVRVALFEVEFTDGSQWKAAR